MHSQTNRIGTRSAVSKLISLIISVVAVMMVYLALWNTGLFVLPICMAATFSFAFAPSFYYYSVAVLPHIMALCCLTVGLYGFIREDKSKWKKIAGWLALATAFSIKPSYMLILTLLLPLYLLKANIKMTCLILSSVLPSVIWFLSTIWE